MLDIGIFANESTVGTNTTSSPFDGKANTFLARITEPRNTHCNRSSRFETSYTKSTTSKLTTNNYIYLADKTTSIIQNPIKNAQQIPVQERQRQDGVRYAPRGLKSPQDRCLPSGKRRARADTRPDEVLRQVQTQNKISPQKKEVHL